MLRLQVYRLRRGLPGRVLLRGEKILYIHPDECIDCEACVPECPVEAIFHEDNVPEEWKDFTALNAEMASQCEVITEKKEPMCRRRVNRLRLPHRSVDTIERCAGRKVTPR